MIKKTALVIGSKGHSQATSCIDWGDKEYLPDYDVVIVNLTSLNSRTLEEIVSEHPLYLEDMRRQIVDAQSRKQFEVICIMDDLFVLSEAENGSAEDFIANNNYSWSPIVPALERVSNGKRINRNKSRINPAYLNLIDSWENLFHGNIDNTGFKKQSGREVNISREFLLVNDIDKAIAFSLSWSLSEYGLLRAASSNPIVFLPKPKNIKMGIDILLKDVLNPEVEPIPSWVSEIELPGEAEIGSSIKEINEKIDTLNKDKLLQEDKLRDLSKYKELLYGTGKSLERIVQESFEFLGVQVFEPPTSEKEDRFFKVDDIEIPIEIRGKNDGMKEVDINQLIGRLADKKESDKFTLRGLFVLNHFRNLPLAGRSQAFHHNIVEKAKPWAICLMTTETLFEVVSLKMSGADLSNFEEVLLNSIGVFDLNKVLPPTKE